MYKKWLLILALVVLCTVLFCACGGNAEEAVMEFWPLSDGLQENDKLASALPGGTAGTAKWGIWLNTETFGKVLDFSTEESYAYFPDTKADLTGDFTISVWVKAPRRDVKDRVLLQYGDRDGIKLFLDHKEDFVLTAEFAGMQCQSSGVKLDDGKWHHVVLARAAEKLTYYIDGEKVTTCTLSGVFALPAKADLYVGADRDGIDGFDGSVARLKLAKGAFKPNQMDDTVLAEADNIPKDTRLSLKKGIVIDRPQYFANLVPQSYTEKQDIINCIQMGFDHVKIQLVPEWMIGDDGEFLSENMDYVNSVVEMIQELDYQVIVCVSPCAAGIFYDFKSVYLGNLEKFEELCRWYAGLAQYAKDHNWDPDHVAIQLMTEPYDNTPTVRWSWMSDRMYGAVRNILPEHTIITSANRSGNLEYVKYMSPATDDNLIYSFTTYEPYAVGWHTAYTSQVGQESFWNYIGDIPYPIEEGVDYTEQIEAALASVPSSYYSTAKDALMAYVRGDYDGGTTYWENHYDSLYNSQWHMLRAESLDQWSKDNGGNIHLMVVEFGCYDNLYGPQRLGAAGPGISDSKRVLLVKDMRQAWEAYNIGWCYWSYNEGFTIFTPQYHVNHIGDSPTAEEAARYADYAMLTEGLGLTPDLGFESEALSAGAAGAWTLTGAEGLAKQVAASADAVLFAGEVTEEGLSLSGSGGAVVNKLPLDITDKMTLSAGVKAQSDGVILSSGQAWVAGNDTKLYIHDFDDHHNFWGSNLGHSDEDPAQGTGSLWGGISGRGDLVFTFQTQLRDMSAYFADNNGILHLSIYVTDPKCIGGGQLELTAASGPNDNYELSWRLPDGGRLKAGWNDVTFRLSDAFSNSTDISDIHCCRIYFHCTGAVEIKLDDMYLTYAESKQEHQAWQLSIENGELQFAAGGKSVVLTQGADLTDGQWHQLRLQVEGEQLTAFVDGNAHNTQQLPGLSVAVQQADLVLGSDIFGGNGITGMLKDVLIYPMIPAA